MVTIQRFTGRAKCIVLKKVYQKKVNFYGSKMLSGDAARQECCKR